MLGSLSNFIFRSLSNKAYDVKPDQLIAIVQENKLDVLKKLLKKQANYDLIKKTCLLNVAIDAGHIKLVKLLLKSEFWCQDEEGNSPLHYAANQSNINIGRLIIQYIAKNKINQKNKKGLTALHYACKVGNKNYVKLLKENGALKAIDMQDNKERLPLHYAAMHNVKLIELVLNKNLVYERDIFFKQPIMYAIEKGCYKVFITLKNHMRILENLPDSEGNSLLYLAVKGRNTDIIIDIVKSIRNVNKDQCNNNGDNPMHLAARIGDLKICTILLENHCTIDIANSQNNTPAHIAARYGHLDIIKLLVQKKNSLLGMVDINENTLLHIAAFYGHIDIVKYLATKTNVNICNRNGDTPLHMAVRHGQNNISKFLTFEESKKKKDKYFKIVEYLLKKGANVKITNKQGVEPIHIAFRTNSTKEVTLLERKGADINSKDQDGRTELFSAISKGDLEQVRSLIKQNIVLKDPDIDGLTILHTATARAMNPKSSKALEIVEEILKYKIDINAQDKDGNTALHFACERSLQYKKADIEQQDEKQQILLKSKIENNKSIIKLLIMHGAKKNITNNEGKIAEQLINNEDVEQYFNDIVSLGVMGKFLLWFSTTTRSAFILLKNLPSMIIANIGYNIRNIRNNNQSIVAQYDNRPTMPQTQDYPNPQTLKSFTERKSKSHTARINKQRELKYRESILY